MDQPEDAPVKTSHLVEGPGRGSGGISMRPLHENLAGRLLDRLAGALDRHPRWFFYPQVLVFFVCVVFTVQYLQFSTDRNDLISAENRHRRNYLEFQQDFKARDSLVVIVESGEEAKSRAFVERLAARLRREPNLFANIYYKGDLRLMGNKALLFLPEETLEELRRALTENRPLIRSFSRANNFNSLLDLVLEQFRTLASAPADQSARESFAGALPSLERMFDQALGSIAQPTVLPAPGVVTLFGNDQDARRNGLYLTFGGGRLYIVTAEAASPAVETAAVKRLRELLDETKVELPGLNAGLTGEPVLKEDEMRQARRDTDKAALISLVLSAFIFIYGYHELRRPLIATACLLVGIGYALGFATLAVGRLNLLSLTLVPILIGVAIDFGVHLISRYEEELRRGSDCPLAIRKALVFTGLGIFTSGLTTAGAFFAMTLTRFQGIREMGLISGVGLLVCLVPMMTLLPLLLRCGKRQTPDVPALSSRGGLRQRIEQVYLGHPRIVLACGLVLSVFALLQLPRVRFDYNLLHLQTRGLPAVGLEQKLLESGSQSILYCAVIADSLPKAAELESRVRQLPSVASVVSLVKYLTENQDHKLELMRDIKREIAAIHLPGPDASLVDANRLAESLMILRRYLGVGIDQLAADKSNPRLETQLRSLRDAVERLRRAVAGGSDQLVVRLTAFQLSLFSDLQETLAILRLQDDTGRLRAEDLPPFLRDRFISANGRVLLQVYPREDVWQREPQERFVRELRTVAPEVTGSPVQFYEYTAMLKDNFQRAAGYASAVIALLVLLHFRRIGSVLLAFLPVLLGFVWTLGWMGWMDIAFNPVNIMALTLIIGIGVTNGIHILNRFAEEEHPSILARSTGKAVLVSALTTMAGFGSLMVAKHQGIASLGKVMLIGTAMCMIASLALLPAVLNLLSRVGWSMRRKPRPASDTELLRK
jgi:hopanoid biosynthesis associated RND transporter like protein HpnN